MAVAAPERKKPLPERELEWGALSRIARRLRPKVTVEAVRRTQLDPTVSERIERAIQTELRRQREKQERQNHLQSA